MSIVVDGLMQPFAHVYMTLNTMNNVQSHPRGANFHGNYVN